ncbi:MAG: sodium:solute symporter [Leadbetterella sp.]
MTPIIAVSILSIYFLVLIIISFRTSKGADTQTFFMANKQSPWYLVAFAMIGTSLSGVTFISVPGAVGGTLKGLEGVKAFSYFQMVLGYLVGYVFIGMILMPLYYRLNLVSIYTYLEEKLGFWSYKTGSAFFLLSRTLGSAVRLYIAAKVLQIAIYDPLGIPFEISVLITIGLIWLYTFKGGVKTIIITDTLQTTFLILAVGLTIWLISKEITLDKGLLSSVFSSEYGKIFFFDSGIGDTRSFWKQFLSGALIATVMTGLDQDLMQKNLTCKNIGEAQKNMFWFTIVLVIVNLMFLSLGVLLYFYATQKGIEIPAKTDELYPLIALQHFGAPGAGTLELMVAISFLIGITAATYASSDSALTALTTSFCIDFMNVNNKPEEARSKIKFWVHIGFSLLFYVVIIIFARLNSADVVTAIFKIASYTYGPLLGLFMYGLLIGKRLGTYDVLAPIVCIGAPIFTYLLVSYIENNTSYRFLNENLIINGLITFGGLLVLGKFGSKKVA